MRLQSYINESKKPYITMKDFNATGSHGNECGAIAYVLRERGYGDIYFGQVGPKDDYMNSYPHYWVQKGSKVYDPQSELLKDNKLERWDVIKLGPKEHPDNNIWGEKEYEYWRGKIKEK